jgi:hypothetical protein
VARLRGEHGVDEEPVAARGGHATGAGVRAGDEAQAPPDRPSRCGWWPATTRVPMPATRCATPPAGRPRCSVRPAP